MKLSKAPSINGTHLQGYVRTTLAELIRVFGQPHMTDGDKTTVEWAFLTDRGVVFTIYDYKTYGTPVNEYDWHIGGHDQRAALVVQHLFPTALVEFR